MMILRLLLLPLLILAAAVAESNQPATLRSLIEDIAVSFPRQELQACAAAHPQHGASFIEASARFIQRIDGLLDEMAASDALLSQPVPAEFMAFQAMNQSLTDSDFRERSLPECQGRIREFDALQDSELKAGMSETAGAFSETIKNYRRNMDKALGGENQP
jgi:hypothetical protein